MDALKELKMNVRENIIPYFSDEELVYYLEKNNGDVRKASYECLILKAEELIEHGVHISEIVLAEKKYLPQKRNASLENKIAINRLLEQNVKVMVQEFPNEEAFVIEKYRIEGRREGE